MTHWAYAVQYYDQFCVGYLSRQATNQVLRRLLVSLLVLKTNEQNIRHCDCVQTDTPQHES